VQQEAPGEALTEELVSDYLAAASRTTTTR